MLRVSKGYLDKGEEMDKDIHTKNLYFIPIQIEEPYKASDRTGLENVFEHRGTIAIYPKSLVHRPG